MKHRWASKLSVHHHSTKYPGLLHFKGITLVLLLHKSKYVTPRNSMPEYLLSVVLVRLHKGIHLNAVVPEEYMERTKISKPRDCFACCQALNNAFCSFQVLYSLP